jgi:hypothetical protein
MRKALDALRALALLLGLMLVGSLAVAGFTLILAVLPIFISWFIIYVILRYRREQKEQED